LIGDNYKSPELVEIVIYYASGYLCRRLLKSTKCDVCLHSFLTNVDSSDLSIVEFVNMKTQIYLLNCINIIYNLYKLFLNAEFYFTKNVILSDCYEKNPNYVLLGF